MANTLFRQNLILKIKGAIEEAKNASNLDHNYLIGRVREIVISNLFSPLLSDNFSIGTGKITDYNGSNSSETDLIIYTKKLIPPLMFSTDFGYFPKESVLAVLEIKSKLTLAELRTTKTKFDNLETLQMTSGYFNSKHEGDTNKNVTGVIKSLFAFSTDLTASTDLERLLKEYPEAQNESFINSICVVGKGYWTFSYTEKIWKKVDATNDHEEVIRFLSSLINSLNDSLESRGNPRIGSYLTDVNPIDI